MKTCASQQNRGQVNEEFFGSMFFVQFRNSPWVLLEVPLLAGAATPPFKNK